MNQKIVILRDLANQYAHLLGEKDGNNIWDLHAGINDLSPRRSTVLIDELPWHELNIDGSLTLQCQNPIFRKAENYLRKILF